MLLYLAKKILQTPANTDGEKKRLHLCCTVIPIKEQSTNAGNAAEGINKCGQ